MVDTLFLSRTGLQERRFSWGIQNDLFSVRSLLSIMVIFMMLIINGTILFIIPGPFRVKIPLELIDNNLDEEANEFDYLENIQKKIIEYIFCEYTISNPDFSNYMKECGYDADKVFKEVMEERSGIYTLFEKYSRIYKYFDDWIVVKSDAEYKNMTEIIVKKSENVHVETCFW